MSGLAFNSIYDDANRWNPAGGPVFAERRYTITPWEVVVPSGSAFSQCIDMFGYSTLGFLCPDALTADTDYAYFSGSVAYSEDDAVYHDCYNGNGGAIRVQLVPGTVILPSADQLYGLRTWRWIKLRLATGAGASVVQAADRTFYTNATS